MLTGRLAGSTPDPTDSLVIPLGLAIALWVWTRFARADHGEARRRLALLLAGVAAIGSVASIESSTEVGVGRVEIREDGAVVATTFQYAIGSRQPVESFTSSDGGLTWTKTGQLHRGEEADLVASADEGVETPRGRYVIHGQGIMLIGADGESELAYSTAYLREDGNVWVQKKWTTQLGKRSIATGARYIAYHERSGNLIAAMGIQGVVVGTPDGEWTRYAVGPYSPADFSFSGKTGLLLSNGGFWATTLALSLSATGLALVLSRYRRGDLFPMLAAVALTGLVLFSGVPMLIGALGHSPRMELVFLVALVFSPLVTPAITRGVVALGLMPMDGWLERGLGSGLALSCLLASGALLSTFGSADPEEFGNVSATQTVLAVPAFVLGMWLLAISGALLRHWPAVIAAFLGMSALVVLVFMLWLHLGISLALAQVSTVVLAALAGLVLISHIKRRQVGQPSE